jgi:hypothetical protein
VVEEEASTVVVVLVVAVSTVAEEAEVEVQGLPGDTSLVESVLLEQDSVVVPRTTMAEACVSLIRAPGRFVLGVVDRPRLPDRIAG